MKSDESLIVNTEYNHELQSESGDQNRVTYKNEISNKESGEVEITATRALNNIECQLNKGSKEARELGIVSLPVEEGLEFAVLDQSGTRFSELLPFRANKVRLGVRSDGSVLAGLGELRLNSRVFKSSDAPQPLRIYHNNHVIFETETAWDFDIATDGTSFVVHEPTPSDASRLIIRNLDLGTEIHHDLGSKFTPKSDYEKPFALKYSLNNDEIMFEPAHADAMGRGTHWFFPVARGKPRLITVKYGMAAVFSDSSNLYFLDYASKAIGENRDRAWKVSRKELNPAIQEEKVIWEKIIELDHFYGTVVLSPNGRWLALSSWDYTVLSADTGETKLKFPVAGDNELQLQRLSEVLTRDAEVEDIGAFVGSSFIDDHLVFYRRVGNLKSCNVNAGSTYDHVAYLSCIRELRLKGRYRNFQDIFDMNETTIDGSPIYRSEIYRDSPCDELPTRMRGLHVVEGELTFGLASDSQVLNFAP